LRRAWHRLLPQVTENDLVEHRRQRARDAWKQTMRASGAKLPTQVADGRSRCYCGAEIDIAGMDQHVYAAHMVQ
jgi:hypothetical protein